MAEVLVILAHPDLARSRVNAALALAARALPDAAVEVRDLYALYPDFLVDVEAEQACLAPARTVVWLHPVQWYAMPALMKLWLDEVFAFGWAYGPEGRALAGKRLWLAVSTGGTEESYARQGSHARPFAEFLAPCVQSAALVGMEFLEPMVFHGAHRADDTRLQAHVAAFARRLAEVAAAQSISLEPQPAVSTAERLPVVPLDERPGQIHAARPRPTAAIEAPR